MKPATRIVLCSIFVPALFIGLIQSAWAITVGEILAKPDDFYGRSVTVTGQVVETYEFMVRFFGVEDATGRIKIRTDKPMPTVLSTMEVSGTVSKELARNGTYYPMINEETRKVIAEAPKKEEPKKAEPKKEAPKQ